jgi:hypothetical protein
MGIQAEFGSIDSEDVAEAMEQHFKKLSRCYESSGATADFASGQVTLRFLVGLDGKSTLVHVRNSDLGSLEVERCLATEAAQIRFGRPQGFGVTSFEYSLEFRSTGAIPVTQLEPGTLSAELPVIGLRLQRDCGGMAIDEVRATLYIDRRGRVRSVGFASTIPLPPDQAACYQRSLRRETLPIVVHGATLGRVAIALRRTDAVAARPPSPPLARSTRPVQGRRGRRR